MQTDGPVSSHIYKKGIQLIQLKLSLKAQTFDQSNSKREKYNGRVHFSYQIVMLHVSKI
jgi:ribosomal protein L31E